MQTRLQKIGKILMILALASVLIQNWNFANSFVPKPFQVLLIATLVVTIIDIIKNNRLKELKRIFPKNIWIAGIVLIIAILFGWFLATFAYGVPYSFNAVLEFGTFIFSLSIFFLIVWYSHDDAISEKWFLYALLIPVGYVVFIIFPSIARDLQLTSDSKFLGLTVNPNTVSKMLLAPTVFFIAKTIDERKKIWSKVLYFLLAAGMVALTLWTGSRGALVSLIVGAVAVVVLCMWQDFSWKKFFAALGLIVGIIAIGFVFTPYTGKQVILDRVLNFDNNQLTYSVLKNESLPTIIHNSLSKPSTTNPINQNIHAPLPEQPLTVDTRLEIWPHYLKLVLTHPFGYGPNTHMQTGLPSEYGGYLNTGPHNTYLEVWLWAGILGLISFLYILWVAINGLWITTRKNPTIKNIALFATLLAFLVGIVFDDSLSVYSFFIVLGLAYVAANQYLFQDTAISKYLQPKKYFDFIVRKAKGVFSGLENGGERLDILFKSTLLLSDNEKCHLNRYQFAATMLNNKHIADLACGTGYGSVILAANNIDVVGIDIDKEVIEKITEKYKAISNLRFQQGNLLDIHFENAFDAIVSFETVEHFAENDIEILFTIFNASLKHNGKLVFSTPYMQKNDKTALDMGFHKTFFINEEKIHHWMKQSGFVVIEFQYQSYDSPDLAGTMDKKDFIICIAQKV